MYNIKDFEQRCIVYYGFNTVLQAEDFMEKMELDKQRYAILKEEKHNG